MRTEEECSDDAQTEEYYHEAVEVATDLCSLIRKSTKMLDQLSNWAEKYKNRLDSKASALLGWLDLHLKRMDDGIISG